MTKAFGCQRQGLQPHLYRPGLRPVKHLSNPDPSFSLGTICSALEYMTFVKILAFGTKRETRGRAAIASSGQSTLAEELCAPARCLRLEVRMLRENLFGNQTFGITVIWISASAPSGTSMKGATGSHWGRRTIMNTTKIAILILAIACVLYILIPGLSWENDESALRGACSSRCLPAS